MKKTIYSRTGNVEIMRKFKERSVFVLLNPYILLCKIFYKNEFTLKAQLDQKRQMPVSFVHVLAIQESLE